LSIFLEWKTELKEGVGLNKLQEQSSNHEEAVEKGLRAGFSPKINDPAFATYQKKAIIWSFLFASILAVIAIIAFPIYGKVSEDIEWPFSLYYGMGIGGMFVAIALLQTLRKKLDHTWDGVVVFKDSYQVKNRSRSGRVSYHMVYVMKVRKDNGGTKTHRWRNTPGVYQYYQVNDQVRHHKGFSYYEKYDKSKDKQILCPACQSFQDISNDNCKKCKCPLLK
jgi:hypothetical protein